MAGFPLSPMSRQRPAHRDHRCSHSLFPLRAWQFIARTYITVFRSCRCSPFFGSCTGQGTAAACNFYNRTIGFFHILTLLLSPVVIAAAHPKWTLTRCPLAPLLNTLGFTKILELPVLFITYPRFLSAVQIQESQASWSRS